MLKQVYDQSRAYEQSSRRSIEEKDSVRPGETKQAILGSAEVPNGAGMVT